MKSKKIVITLLIIMFLTAFLCNTPAFSVQALDGEVGQNYIVFDENYNYLFEKTDVSEGDFYISKAFKKYEIIYVNHVNKTGIAKFVEQLKKPKVSFSLTPSPITTTKRNIGLYMTHNDESYLPSDGYYTIYGKGGIHDVANKLKTTFTNMGINVALDETLHLPHDSSAYSRSNVTAKRLLNQNELNAIFDIHRDGASRGFYAINVNGVERSRIRIVVGKANGNMKKNEEFATYLVAVADELYPWLIADIYYATGHYNQALSEKALLFEMGTHLIEKELVMASVEPLAHVINVALFNTTVNTETGELEIGGNSSSQTPIIDELFNSKNEQGLSTMQSMAYLVLTLLCVAIVVEIGLVVTKNIIKLKNRKKDNK